MTKHPYKPIESGISGDIFIIKEGLRIKKLGLFHSLEDARIKCDELNFIERVEEMIDGSN